MITEIKAWKCSWCKKVYQIHSRAMIHENRCMYDPKWRACVTCNHFHGLLYNDMDSGEGRYCVIKHLLCPYRRNCEYWQERPPEYAYWIRSQEEPVGYDHGS